ncbi:MAG: hypothetical protein JSV38_03370 [Desulfobacterales bacterium]|nr:MAG: hypothetical protein JSV38_03370 [Desulfobacterales bacterium]
MFINESAAMFIVQGFNMYRYDHTNSFKEKWLIFVIALVIVLTFGVEAKALQSLQTGYVKVLFDTSLKSAAEETLHLYPQTKEDIESLFNWKLRTRPSVLLVKTREYFQKMAGDALVVAFAVPEKNLIVIDYSKMIKHPFSLETTLKHELAHLLLHQHVNEDILPRWLVEGLCQWASGGIGEIIKDPKSSLLNRAAFSRKFIRLDELQREFPFDKRDRLLAYEESKSFITYLAGRFGKEIILQVLYHMKNGKTAEASMQTASAIPFADLEKQWHHFLRKKITWFTFLSYYLYEILFTLMAFTTVVAFIRQRIKKKRYVDDEPEDV